MVYGAKANIRVAHRFFRMGALVWITNTNPGWGSEKVEVVGLTRGGRNAKAWIDARDLTNWRPGWLSDGDKNDYFQSTDWGQHNPRIPIGTKAEAEKYTAMMNERFASQPVREHVKQFMQLVATEQERSPASP